MSLDFLAVDRGRERVWVPVGDTGSVAVLDVPTGRFMPVGGFATVERENGSQKRKLGPSSAAVGDGVVYVGDRGSSEVCAVDAVTLKRGACITLGSAPDALAYVASTKELWVTTPRDSSIVVLDASRAGVLRPKTAVRAPGSPECAAVDDARGLFFTNLEDKDQTLAIDLKTRKVMSTWPSRCGGDGPRGIAVDAATGIVMVACTDHLELLDGRRDGAPLAKIDTGAGVDDVDWSPSDRLLYVGAGRSAQLSIVHVGEKGEPRIVAVAQIPEGARNAVSDSHGTVYLVDPKHGGVFVVPSQTGVSRAP